jgi:hypothetical protein
MAQHGWKVVADASCREFVALAGCYGAVMVLTGLVERMMRMEYSVPLPRSGLTLGRGGVVGFWRERIPHDRPQFVTTYQIGTEAGAGCLW